MEQLQIDVVCETVDEFWPGIDKIFDAQGDEKKNELRNKLANEEGMKRISKLEKLLKKNKDGNGWLAGDEVQNRVGFANFEDLSTILGLFGSNSKEQLDIDVVCETADDLWPGILKIFETEGDEEKDALRKKFAEEGAMKHISNLEKLLKSNKGGRVWFIGDKVTLADIMAFNMIYDYLPFILNIKEGEFDLKEHDVLKAFVERFKAQEKIANWIKRRPKTRF
ncbi:S-crystallin SL11 [Holothuria leucospilota]|uniref:S-crystallin SL11 n=1 Tax=Holothuria leucospilota TaxID=206669 RepID=A0A9Q1HF86_HOLLE|nr:S-crystallin SL11 [Holothuria leucospilota]